MDTNRPDLRIADDGSEFQTLHEIVRAARQKLDERSWDLSLIHI